MGILQSVLQTLGIETEEDENDISSLSSYNWNSSEKSPHQWQNGNRPTRSHQMTYLTVSVPELKDSSSLAYTSVNHSVKKEAAFALKNAPPKAYGGARRREMMHQVYSVISPAASSVLGEPLLGNAIESLTENENVDGDRNEIDDDAVVWNAPQMGCSNASMIVEEVVAAPDQEEEEVEKAQIKSIDVVGEEKRIKHYSSRHKILLVGEGDFSFSTCLAVAFGSATNIIATSFNAKAFLKKNYGSAMSNVAELRRRGSRVMYGIDATDIANHDLLRQIKFNRIIFNFPFAGFFRNLSTECQLRHHRRLVSLFLKNAKEMISENGEIHVSHKTNGFHAEFKLENIASSHGLRLIAAVKFKCSNYPGYNTKYGFGGDKNFDCNPSKTFKFGLKP